MAYIYTCDACKNNNHKDCELTTVPKNPESFAGCHCICPCKGNENYLKTPIDLVFNQIIKIEKNKKQVNLVHAEDRMDG